MKAHWGLALLGLLITAGALYLASLDFSRATNFNYYADLQPLGGDFWIFWAAGNLTANGQARAAYDPAAMQAAMALVSVAPHRPTPFFYPPWHLLFLAPFGALPYFVAYLTYFSLGLLLFLSAVWRWAGGWACLFMLGFAGVWVNFATGQNGLWVAGLLGWAAWLLRRQAAVAGAVFGLLTAKPQLGLWWPILLLAGKHYRAFLVAVGALGLLVTLVTLLMGSGIWRGYLEGSIFAGFVMADHSQLLAVRPSFYTTLLFYGSSQRVALLAHVALALLAGYYLVRLWRVAGRPEHMLALLALAGLLIPPFVHNYDFALLGLVIVALCRMGVGWGGASLIALTYVGPMLSYHLPRSLDVQVGFLLPLVLLAYVGYRIVNDRQIS